jgi:hypothetical protein
MHAQSGTSRAARETTWEVIQTAFVIPSHYLPMHRRCQMRPPGKALVVDGGRRGAPHGSVWARLLSHVSSSPERERSDYQGMETSGLGRWLSMARHTSADSHAALSPEHVDALWDCGEDGGCVYGQPVGGTWTPERWLWTWRRGLSSGEGHQDPDLAHCMLPAARKGRRDSR